jgi:hypothetical protein
MFQRRVKHLVKHIDLRHILKHIDLPGDLSVYARDLYVSLYVSPPSGTYRSPGRSICFTVCGCYPNAVDQKNWNSFRWIVAFSFWVYTKKNSVLIAAVFFVEARNRTPHFPFIPHDPQHTVKHKDLPGDLYVSAGGETYSDI